MKPEERLFDLIGELPDGLLSQTQVPRKRPRHWIPAAVAACLAVAVGFGIWHGSHRSDDDRNRDALMDSFTPGVVESFTPPVADTFTPDAPEHGPELSWPTLSGVQENALRFSMLPVGERDAEYHQVEDPNSIPEEQRPRYLGEPYQDLEGWYLPEDNTGLQYLVHQEEDGSYTLWEFSSFLVFEQPVLDQMETDIQQGSAPPWAQLDWFSVGMDFSAYSYGEVLETIYGVSSAEDLVSVTVDPATMDNSDAGKALQKEIGTHTITDRDSLTALYDAIVDMTCYGSHRWELIDLGGGGGEGGLLNSVRLCRYLTIETVHGTIGHLKYSAAGEQFYEYSGIAYGLLTENIAAKMNEIFGIDAN